MCCRAAPGTCSSSNGNGNGKSLQGCCVGGAGWVRGNRRKYVHVGSPSASMRMSVPTNPPRPTFDRSMGAMGPSVAPTHGRRRVGGMGSDGSRRPWVGATAFLSFFTRVAATGTCQGPGGEAMWGLERQEPRRATWTYLRVPRIASPPGPPPSPVPAFKPPARGSHPFDRPDRCSPPDTAGYTTRTRCIDRQSPCACTWPRRRSHPPGRPGCTWCSRCSRLR